MSGVSVASVRPDANGHRRREVRATILAEESDCWLCGTPVDKSLTMAWGRHGPRCPGEGCAGCVPHDMRAEVDEVVPRKHGGDPLDRANCRLAHRKCNRDRNKTKPAMPELYVLSGAWSDMPWGGDPHPGG